MTDAEALAEAHRRWGARAFAKHGDYSSPGWPYWCCVGYASYPVSDWWGSTWEEAFTLADRDQKKGIPAWCPTCLGRGSVEGPDGKPLECPTCHGCGLAPVPYGGKTMTNAQLQATATQLIDTIQRFPVSWTFTADQRSVLSAMRTYWAAADDATLSALAKMAGVGGMHAMALYPYPTDVVTPATLVLDVLRGTAGIPKADAVHAAWQLAGVALSYIPGQTRSAGPVEDCDPVTALETLLVHARGDGTAKMAITVPWATILKAAITVLTDLLPLLAV